jgi:hypothetical protein
MDRQAKIAVVETFFDGLRSRNGSVIRFAPEVEFESPMTHERVTGAEAAAAFLTNVAGIVKDVRVHQFIVEGEHTCVRWEFDTLDPPTTIAACAYFRLRDDGLISHVRAYHDPRPFTNARAIALLRGGV